MPNDNFLKGFNSMLQLMGLKQGFENAKELGDYRKAMAEVQLKQAEIAQKNLEMAREKHEQDMINAQLAANQKYAGMLEDERKRAQLGAAKIAAQTQLEGGIPQEQIPSNIAPFYAPDWKTLVEGLQGKKMPSTIQEFEYAKERGFPGDIWDYKKAGASQINIGTELTRLVAKETAKLNIRAQDEIKSPEFFSNITRYLITEIGGDKWEAISPTERHELIKQRVSDQIEAAYGVRPQYTIDKGGWGFFIDGKLIKRWIKPPYEFSVLPTEINPETGGEIARQRLRK